MGNLASGGFWPAGARLESVFRTGHFARDHLRTIDRRHHAAKR